jgi:hypothetical protein
MVPHFLDEFMAKPTGHGPRDFVPSVNLNWNRQHTIGKLMIVGVVTFGGFPQKLIPTSPN